MDINIKIINEMKPINLQPVLLLMDDFQLYKGREATIP